MNGLVVLLYKSEMKLFKCFGLVQGILALAIVEFCSFCCLLATWSGSPARILLSQIFPQRQPQEKLTDPLFDECLQNYPRFFRVTWKIT